MAHGARIKTLWKILAEVPGERLLVGWRRAGRAGRDADRQCKQDGKLPRWCNHGKTVGRQEAGRVRNRDFGFSFQREGTLCKERRGNDFPVS